MGLLRIVVMVLLTLLSIAIFIPSDPSTPLPEMEVVSQTPRNALSEPLLRLQDLHYNFSSMMEVMANQTTTNHLVHLSRQGNRGGRRLVWAFFLTSTTQGYHLWFVGLFLNHNHSWMYLLSQPTSP